MKHNAHSKTLDSLPKVDYKNENFENFVVIEASFNPYQNHEKEKNILISFDEVIKNAHLPEHSKFAIVSHYLDFPSKLHSHDYIEIIYLPKGTLLNVINHTPHIMEEGSLCLLTSGCEHFVAQLPNDQPIPLVINFLIHPQVFQKIFTSFQLDNNTLPQQLAKTQAIVLNKIDAAPIHLLLQQLMAEYYNAAHQTNYAIIGYLAILVEKIIDLNQQATPIYDELTKNCLKLIHEEFATISLETIAKKLNYSKGYLSRHIKKQTNQTISQLIMQEKLYQAEKYLSETDYTIAEITERVHYQSESHFYRIFKEHFQITPNQYRKLFQV